MTPRIFSAALTAGLLTAACAEPAPSTLEYTWLTQGNVAGSQTVNREDATRFTVHFEFNDRGRGPLTDATVELDRRGLPVRIESSGNDYLKTPVTERFERTGSEATWTNQAENGASSDAADAFFMEMNGAPEMMAVLVRALLEDDDGRIPLLPAGEARLETLRTHTVTADGTEHELTQYAVHGLGFQPTTLWLDENDDLAVFSAGWSGLVRNGLEPAFEELAQIDQDASTEWLSSLGEQFGRTPGAVAITGARVFHAESGDVSEGMTVVVQGSTIAQVTADGLADIPAGAEVIEANGRMVLPGLWDMHVHTSALDGLLNIAAGITTVRDLANDTDILLENRSRFDEGSLVGPRVIMGGFMDGPGPFAGPTRVLVDTEEEIHEAVDNYAELGYEQIKMYSSIDTELVGTIIERAHSHGMRVSGHIPAFMTAEQAVRLGFDEIQHTNMLFLNFLGDTLDTRTPVRFSAVAQNAPDLDLQSAEVQSFLRLLRDRNVTVDPTITVFHSMFTSRPGTMDPNYAMAADRLPPTVARGFLAGGLPVPDGMDERYREAADAMMAMVKAVYDAGVPIVAGTDGLAGFTLHRELELYAEAGIPNEAVLRLATLGSAEVMGREDRVGRVALDQWADLILVDGDPTEDMTDIRKVDLVVKGGTVFEPSRIYPALGITPWGG